MLRKLVLGAAAIAGTMAAGFPVTFSYRVYLEPQGGSLRGLMLSDGCRVRDVSASDDWPDDVSVLGYDRFTNRGDPEGYAVRLHQVILDGDARVEASIRPSPPGDAPGEDGFACLDLDQMVEGSETPAFYGARVRPTEGGFVCFLATHEDDNVGSVFIPDTQALDVGLFVDNGDVTFVARGFGGSEDDWVPVASTPLADPLAPHTFGTGASSLATGESFDIVVNRVEGQVTGSFVAAADRVAVAYSNLFRSIIVGSSALGGAEPDPAGAAEAFGWAADECRSILDDIDDVPASKARDKAIKELEKAAKQLDKAVDKALDGKALPAVKAALKGRKVVLSSLERMVEVFPPGGQGGGDCLTDLRNLAAGESCTATWEGVVFAASRVLVTLPEVEGDATVIDFWQCFEEKNIGFTVYFYGPPYTPGPPEVGVPYEHGISSPIGMYRQEDTAGNLLTFHGAGTVTFTEVDAATGTYAGTFTHDDPLAGVSVSDGAFRIVGAK
jgi:hypothetical protein